MKDSLGDRMKGFYEDRYRIKLSRRTPVIIKRTDIILTDNRNPIEAGDE